MDEPVKNITSEDGGKTVEIPETRIGSAADAREIVGKFQAGERTRSDKRARVNGLLNGNRPWSHNKLVKAGQGERTNLNLRTGEGFVAGAKSPYWDLVFEVDRYAQFTIDYGADPSLEQEWADHVGKRYHETLDGWDAMDTHFQRSQYQMVVHGQGPMVWENATDWRSISKMAGEILLPDDASADPEEWETFAIPRPYTPTQLWQKIKNAGTAEKVGDWNVREVRAEIMKAATEDSQKRFNQAWDFYEAEIRKGSAGWDNKSKRIFAVNLFQREFDGKISHFILVQGSVSDPATTPPAGTAAPGASDKPEQGFLYRKIGRFNSVAEIVCGFLYDAGPDGDWHSVKGAGPKIFDFCEVENRLTSMMIDGATVSSGIAVKAQDSNALQETAITNMTGGIVVGPKYDIQQTRLVGDLQSPLLVKRDLKNTLDGNTGNYRTRVADETPYPTLGQEQMDAARQAVLRGGDINRYYRSLDKWHRETFRRLLKMGEDLYSRRKDLAPDKVESSQNLTPSEKGALKFYRALVETDEVPEEVLKFENFCRIKATRSIGNGSAQMRQMIGNELVSLLPTMDERARNTALRMKVSAIGGQTLADLLYPRFDQPQLGDAHLALATLENNALRMPQGQVAIEPQQNHVIHFGVHMKDVGVHAEQVQAGQSDPAALMVHLEQAGPHTHQHLQQVAGDPTRKAQVEAMEEAWLNMSRMADQLRQQLEEAAQAAEANQPQQAPDPKLIAELAKVRMTAEVLREKMLLDAARKDEKQAADLRRKDFSTAHNMRLSAAKAA